MTIIKTIKSSVKLIALNPSLALFFILFLLAFNFLVAYVFVAKTIAVALILAFCAFLLLVSFVSGWLGLIKNIVQKEQVCQRPFSIFLEEIGKNIIPVATGMFLYFAITVAVIAIMGELNLKIFGNPDVIFQELVAKTQTPEMYNEFLKNLSDDKKFMIYGWQLTIIFATFILNYLFLFYPCFLIEKNNVNLFLKPFVALKNNIVFTFKKFLKTISVFFIIGILNLFIVIVRQLLAGFKFGGIIFLFLYIYFAISVVVLIFNYYEKNNCSNGCDCVREDESSDKISEEA